MDPIDADSLDTLPPVIGMMSGTSMDGVDAVVLRTDGERVGPVLASHYEAYDASVRDLLRDAGRGMGDRCAAEEALMRYHERAVQSLMAKLPKVTTDRVCLIGFPGQTLRHDPVHRWLDWLGNPGRLAVTTGIDVVSDFRRHDMAAGGEGAPLVPLFHAALAKIACPGETVVVVNIGGVANMTWVGSDGALQASDVGPGMARLDDLWREAHRGQASGLELGWDEEGRASLRGRADFGRIANWLGSSFFLASGPKSLDRDDCMWDVSDLPLADGLATLAEGTAAAIARSVMACPRVPTRAMITGGGRRHRGVMEALARLLPMAVAPIEEWGWHGDWLEAAAFGYLAMRCCRGLPLSLPSTTGVEYPMIGGAYYRAPLQEVEVT